MPGDAPVVAMARAMSAPRLAVKGKPDMVHFLAYAGAALAALRAARPDVAAVLDGDAPFQGVVLIWSGEHRAWWRPNGQGYTADRDCAGRWWANEARAMTAHCGPEKRIVLHRAARPEAS